MFPKMLKSGAAVNQINSTMMSLNLQTCISRHNQVKTKLIGVIIGIVQGKGLPLQLPTMEL